jgi:hypothetical protein
VFSVINRLPDHDAQYLSVNNVFDCQTKKNRLVKKRLITKPRVSNFIEMLQNEKWDNIISNTDVNASFNLFFNTFLVIFESCFPMQYVVNTVYNISGLLMVQKGEAVAYCSNSVTAIKLQDKRDVSLLTTIHSMDFQETRKWTKKLEQQS